MERNEKVAFSLLVQHSIVVDVDQVGQIFSPKAEICSLRYYCMASLKRRSMLSSSLVNFI